MSVESLAAGESAIFGAEYSPTWVRTSWQASPPRTHIKQQEEKKKCACLYEANAPTA